MDIKELNWIESDNGRNEYLYCNKILVGYIETDSIYGVTINVLSMSLRKPDYVYDEPANDYVVKKAKRRAEIMVQNILHGIL